MTPEAETVVTAPEAAPAPELAVTDAPEAVETASADSAATIDDDLRSIYRKGNPDRDASGRFRGTGETAEAEAEVLPDQPLVEAEKPLIAAIPAPQSWSADEKAEWAKLPPKAQEAVQRREREATQYISRQGAELKAYEPLRNVIEQHRDVFERNGVTVDDGLGRLLAAERLLEQNAPAAIVQLANAYGVDLGQFTRGQPEAGTAAPPDATAMAALHQRIQWLEGQLSETSTRVSQREQREHVTQENTVNSIVEKFAADKSEWQALETDILAEIVGINAAVQQGVIEPMTTEATLAKAYDRALRNNPEMLARQQEAQQKAANAKRVEDAQKRAEDAKKTKAINHSSIPAKGQVVQSIDDTLRAAYRQAQARG